MSTVQSKLREKYVDKFIDLIAVYGWVRKMSNRHHITIPEIVNIIYFYARHDGLLFVCGDGSRKAALCPPFDGTNNHAMDVAVFATKTLILDYQGHVWTCGKVKVPKRLHLQHRVIRVSAGLCHYLLLCENGWVQSFGENTEGQMGHASLAKSSVPKTIEKLKKFRVVQISAGDHHSAALTADGDLYCFGDNWCGQCGVGRAKGTEIRCPTKINMDERVVFVECGYNHNLLITKTGLIYSFGNGKYGCLGHGNERNKWKPALIESLKKSKIVRCAAGWRHSICIDTKGKIWSFGNNENGQCALPSHVIKYKVPISIKWFTANKVKGKDCAAADKQSAVIAADGKLYVFGCNYQYRIGLKKPNNYYLPQRFAFPQKNMSIKEIALGKDYSAFIF